METMEKVNIQTASKGELINIYNELINELKTYVETTTYEGKAVYTIVNKLEPLDSNDFYHVGIRMEKRFKRYLKQAYNKRSIESVNKLFHLVHKRILNSDSIPKIVSEQHIVIQKVRKEWKEYQLIADKLMGEYKKAKGDYYKENNFILNDSK